MVSPFFEDLLSIPQPSDSESIDGLPVIQFSEDAELLGTLVSMLYPVRRVKPDSYEMVLNLLAACQKYDMVQVQSSIRAKVNRGTFPAPVGTEGFRAYAIACNKGLIPEMEKAAHMTLDHPMTLETLGEALLVFDGSALRDLARFRERCRDNLFLCLKSSLEAQGTNSWYCPNCGNWSQCNLSQQVLPPNDGSKKHVFTDPVTPLNIHGTYSKALAGYATCIYCGGVRDTTQTLSADLKRNLAQARDKVHAHLSFFSKYLSVHLFSSFPPPRVRGDLWLTPDSTYRGLRNRPQPRCHLRCYDVKVNVARKALSRWSIHRGRRISKMVSVADSDLFVVYMFVICIAFTRQNANEACN